MIPVYRSDPYLFVHETVADGVLEDGANQLVICREQIFAEGGGQPADHGSIIWNGTHRPVLGIVKQKGNTLLRINSIEGLKKGAVIECRLDPERRLRIMRLHSAQHGLAGAIRKLDPSYQSRGMSIDDAAETCAMRFTAAQQLTKDTLEQAMLILSQAIEENRTVRAEVFESAEAAAATLGALLRASDPEVILRGRARVVIIDGLDANACGGTHVKTMGEVVGIVVTALEPSAADPGVVSFKLKH